MPPRGLGVGIEHQVRPSERGRVPPDLGADRVQQLAPLADLGELVLERRLERQRTPGVGAFRDMAQQRRPDRADGDRRSRRLDRPRVHDRAIDPVVRAFERGDLVAQQAIDDLEVLAEIGRRVPSRPSPGRRSSRRTDRRRGPSRARSRAGRSTHGPGSSPGGRTSPGSAARPGSRSTRCGSRSSPRPARSARSTTRTRATAGSSSRRSDRGSRPHRSRAPRAGAPAPSSVGHGTLGRHRTWVRSSPHPVIVEGRGPRVGVAA